MASSAGTMTEGLWSSSPGEEHCCIESLLPTSLHRDYSSFVTDLRSYARDSSSEVYAAVTFCSSIISQMTKITSAIEELATQTGPVCQSGVITPTPVPTTTGEPTIIPTIPITTISSAKAAKPTAFLAGALLAAAAMQ
ncbi:hypothetical protein GGR57DRAFT_486538 [Xylariaceae sp. FL1272]|nr:hypothetical protein GGR57DRAFT_486538 [Xylariaceae sp. FL1272]